MGENCNIFDTSQPDYQNLTHQIIFKALQCLVKDSEYPSKYFPSNIEVSIHPNLYYMVASYHDS